MAPPLWNEVRSTVLDYCDVTDIPPGTRTLFVWRDCIGPRGSSSVAKTRVVPVEGTLHMEAITCLPRPRRYTSFADSFNGGALRYDRPP